MAGRGVLGHGCALYLREAGEFQLWYHYWYCWQLLMNQNLQILDHDDEVLPPTPVVSVLHHCLSHLPK